MSEPQPGPEELSGSEGWTTPEPETTPIPAFSSDADGAAGDDAWWLTPAPPPPPPREPQLGGDAPGSGFPGGPYPGSAFPGGPNPGSAYPGGSDPGSGNPGAGYPGGGRSIGSPGGSYQGGGHPAGSLGGSYPGGYSGAGYPGGRYPGASYRGGGYPGGYPGAGYPELGYPGARRGRGLAPGATVALIATVAIVAAGIGAGVAYVAKRSSPAASTASAPPLLPQNGSGNQGIQPPAGGQQPGSGGPSDIAGITAKVDPALVDVNVTFGYQYAGGAGTGIVLTSNGEVLTNNHVIDGATSISVVDIGNGQTYPASVVGYDSTHDMAVLQLRGASGLRAAVISKSAPTVGEEVVAIGNAGGRGGTPSAAGGSVTALNQSITASDSLDGTNEQLSGLIETNADVQSGDSGGPLVNSAGQVVGMDTAASDNYSFQSQSGPQGFAIPISRAVTTARQIESGNGSLVVHIGPTAFLGVQVGSPALNSGGLPGQGSSSGQGGSAASGAVVAGLVNGGAAQRAGLQAGDVITSLAGQTVGSPTALARILVGHHPGDSIAIGWTDPAGQSHTATLDLGSGPPA